jgi:excisionase family DNA binding protein
VAEQELLRPRDVAAPLGVSRARVYQMIRDGELPTIVVGNAIRIPRRAWEAWLVERNQAASAGMAERRREAVPA